MPKPSARTEPTTYWDYIKVEELLSLQRGIASSEPELTNDEVMFIVVHQIDELWMKLCLRELITVRDLFAGEPVPEHVDEPFDLLFAPAPGGSGPDEEIELDSEDLDTIFHDGSAIDLGREIADTLVLAIDPYPRSAGAEAALKEAGVMTEEEASPFAALAALKNKLGGNGP